MHYTLHLTADCNMNCDYCYVKDTSNTMTSDVTYKVIDNILAAKQQKAGIAFFGGEPLLCKDLIRDTIAYARNFPGETKFYFKITTNGLLLNEEFVEYCKKESIYVAISLDGTPEAHNAHRLDKGGRGTYEKVASAAKLLLKHLPNSPVMMTVNPDTVDYYADSVSHLFELGFIYILCALNYAAKWNAKEINELKSQYKKLAEFYYENTMAEKKFYLSPFEIKMDSHINNRSYSHERCELGKNQVSIAPDGTIYPCIEFVGDEQYAIGDVDSGINRSLQQTLFLQNEKEKPGCDICTIRKRCNHYCACQNKQATGSISDVSPVLCRHEQVLLPIADKLAERLYRKRSELFIQKHYNDYYPILSAIEDGVAR
jgi:uncharacterized protein